MAGSVTFVLSLLVVAAALFVVSARRHRDERGISPARSIVLSRAPRLGRCPGVRRAHRGSSRSRSGPVFRPRLVFVVSVRRRPLALGGGGFGWRRNTARCRPEDGLRMVASRRDGSRRRRLRAPRPHRAHVGQRLRRDLGTEGQDDLRRAGVSRAAMRSLEFAHPEYPARAAAALRGPVLPHRPLGRPRHGAALSVPAGRDATRPLRLAAAPRRVAGSGRPRDGDPRLVRASLLGVSHRHGGGAARVRHAAVRDGARRRARSRPTAARFAAWSWPPR